MVVFSTIIRRVAAFNRTAIIRTTTTTSRQWRRSYNSSSSEEEEKETPEPTPEASLHRRAKFEIDYAQKGNRPFGPLGKLSPPAGFPFKIEDNPGDETITLTRDYQDEVIKVKAHMKLDYKAMHVLEDPHNILLLVVNVSKKDGGGPSLEFSIKSHPDKIKKNNLSVKRKEPNESIKSHPYKISNHNLSLKKKEPNGSQDHQIVAYEGHGFTKLNKKMQKAIDKSYLEMRGIEPSTTNFLHQYMFRKNSREYLTWLNNIKEFFDNYV